MLIRIPVRAGGGERGLYGVRHPAALACAVAREIGGAVSLGTVQERQKLLQTLFDRMYVFRNQMVHGGATYQSRVTGDQVRDGARIMALLVPVFIDLMMDNPGVDWGCRGIRRYFRGKAGASAFRGRALGFADE